MRKKGITAALFGAVLLTGLFSFWVGDQFSERQAKKSAYAARITELEEKANKMRSDADWEAAHPVVSDTEKEEISNSAAALGTQVADLQNAYQRIDAGTDPAGFDANVDALDACFGEDDKNARVPWYTAMAEGEPSGFWRFVTDGTFSGTSKSVLWLCQDGTGSLLAYASGVYHPDQNQFTDMEWHLTTFTASSLSSSGEAPETTASDIGSMIDAMEQMPTAEEPQISEDELSDIKDAQEWLREQMREEAEGAYLPTDEMGNAVEN